MANNTKGSVKEPRKKSNSEEIIEYRNIIMGELVKSKEIIKLLGVEDEEYPEDFIPYKYSYPHEYIPDTIKESGRWINFDISATIDSRNKVYRDLKIFFFILCHRDNSQYIENGRHYYWCDKAVCEIDNIFNETNLLGVGNTEFVSNNPYYPQNKFVGRLLTFEVKDFNRGKIYGR